MFIGTTIFEKIGSLIPGYEGYAEREGRREVDKKLRDFICSKLIDFEKRIYQELDTLVNSNQIAEAKKLDNFRKLLMTFSSKINYAPYGASGLFADEKIDEEKLEQLYQFDLELLQKIETLVSIEDISIAENSMHLLAVAKEQLKNRNHFIQNLTY